MCSGEKDRLRWQVGNLIIFTPGFTELYIYTIVRHAPVSAYQGLTLAIMNGENMTGKIHDNRVETDE